MKEPSKVRERKGNEEIYTHSVCATFETQQNVLCFLKPKIMMFVTGLSLCQVFVVSDSISIVVSLIKVRELASVVLCFIFSFYSPFGFSLAKVEFY